MFIFNFRFLLKHFLFFVYINLKITKNVDLEQIFKNLQMVLNCVKMKLLFIYRCKLDRATCKL